MFIPSVCGGAAWRANVNIGSRREGCGETGFSHAPAPQGYGETGFPHSPPAGGSGRAQPSRVQPPLAPWRKCGRIECLPVTQGKPAGRCVADAFPAVSYIVIVTSETCPDVNISSRSGVWGNQVSPRSRPREGLARTQGDGEMGRPPRGALTPPGPQAGGWGNRVSPSPRLREGVRGRSPCADAGRRPAHPGPRPREGVGGQSPSRNNLFRWGAAQPRGRLT